MFNFASLKAVKSVRFDGTSAYDVIVTETNLFDVGEYYENTEALIQILAEESVTRTPLKWTLKFVGTAPRYYKDATTGKTVQCDSERIAACKALSKALGREYTSDIETLYKALKGSCIRVIAREEYVTNENGEPRRNENGEPMTYFRVKYLAPSKEDKPSMPERIAEAEAKRARKGKREYAGNTVD